MILGARSVNFSDKVTSLSYSKFKAWYKESGLEKRTKVNADDVFVKLGGKLPKAPKDKEGVE